MISELFDLTEKEQQEIILQFDEKEIQDLIFDFSLWARPSQLPPQKEFSTWAIIAGRGFGKTRTGAEWTKAQAQGAYTSRLALIGPTASDVRDTMIEGESGILACSHPDFRPVYTPSKRKLEWPNGVQAFTYSAEEPERLRGPQHGAAWCDELAAWRYWETFEQLEYGLRLGDNPIKIVTTTPKPRKELIELLRASDTVVTKGSTLDNAANLPKKFIDKLLDKYAGTRIGQQEIYAELLEEFEGALWRRAWIDDYRVPQAPEMPLIVVGVDPAVTAKKTSDETGIVAAGIGVDGRYYVLDDRSLIDTPENWAKLSVNLINELQGNFIVAEVNNGGDLVETVLNLHEPKARIRKVWASKGKYARAEPISMLYEQGKVSHVGYLPDLETEMCTWDATDSKARSPNRIDALVWALFFLNERRGSTRNPVYETYGELETLNEFDNF